MLLVPEDVRGVIRVEQADDVQAEVPLEPNNIGRGSVENLGAAVESVLWCQTTSLSLTSLP